MAGDLSHETESFIQSEIAVGTYRDRTDAIEAGVQLLRRRKELLDRLAESRRQLDEGEYVEFDDEGLSRYFEELTVRASGGSKVK